MCCKAFGLKISFAYVFIYGHQCLMMKKRVQFYVPAAELKFLIEIVDMKKIEAL